MSDEIIVIVVGFVLFLVSDYVLFLFEHRKLEKQHIRHKAELEELFQRFLGE